MTYTEELAFPVFNFVFMYFVLFCLPLMPWIGSNFRITFYMFFFLIFRDEQKSRKGSAICEGLTKFFVHIKKKKKFLFERIFRITV
jgi:hypothetical protein